MSGLKPPYTFIRSAFANGSVIPFLGSGASLGRRDVACVPWSIGDGNLPTASELAEYLAASADFPPDERQRDLAKVAQYFDVVIGRDPLKERLHAIFAGEYEPGPIHRYLARCTPPLLIVTTNYDDLIERALRKAGHAFDLVVHSTDVELGDQLLWWPHADGDTADEELPNRVSANQLDIDLKARTVVYKMHGAINREQPERDQYVITEDDYVEFLARMTKSRAVPSIFAEPFQRRPFLFLGYGLYDWNLRVVLNRIEKDLRRPKGSRSWAIQVSPNPVEETFWRERKVPIYPLTIDEFVATLEGSGE